MSTPLNPPIMPLFSLSERQMFILAATAVGTGVAAYYFVPGMAATALAGQLMLITAIVYFLAQYGAAMFKLM